MFSFPAPDNTVVVISKHLQVISNGSTLLTILSGVEGLATEIIHSNYCCQRLLSAQKPPVFERFLLNV
jgi:hypothetical protein